MSRFDAGDLQCSPKVEAYFLAATRIARRRLLFAETQAAVAREAAFAEKRNAKEWSAKGGAKNGGKGAGGGLTQRLAGGSGGEREQQTDDEQEEQKDKKVRTSCCLTLSIKKLSSSCRYTMVSTVARMQE